MATRNKIREFNLQIAMVEKDFYQCETKEERDQ